MDTSQKKDTGEIIAIIIIVLIVAVGGIYFWVNKNPSTQKTTTGASTVYTVNDTSSLGAEFSSSTDVNINSDIDNLGK